MEITTHYRTAFRLFLSPDGVQEKFSFGYTVEDKVTKSLSLFSLGMADVHPDIRGFGAVPMGKMPFSGVILKSIDFSKTVDPLLNSLLEYDGSFVFENLPIGLELNSFFLPYAITPDAAGTTSKEAYAITKKFNDPIYSPKYSKREFQIILLLIELCRFLGIKGWTSSDSILVCMTKKFSGWPLLKQSKEFMLTIFKDIFGEKLLKVKSNELYLYHPEMINSLYHYIGTDEKFKSLAEFVLLMDMYYTDFISSRVFVTPEDVQIDCNTKLIDSLKSNACIVSALASLDLSDWEHYRIAQVKRAIFNS